MSKQTRVRAWIAGMLAVLVFAGLGPGIAGAIEYGGIGGRPAHPNPKVPKSDSIFIYQLKPGQAKRDGIYLVNNTNRAKTLEVYAVDSLVSSGGALSCRQHVEPKRHVGSWIRLSRSEAVVPALGNVEVPFTVRLPARAETGEHNGCIAVQEKNQRPVQKSRGIALTTRTALRVQVTVPGNLRRELDLTDHSVEQGENGKYVVQTKVKNLGNVSVDADLKSTTRYFFGPKLAQSGGKFSVLPQVEAEFNFDLPQPFWGWIYTSKPTVLYDADPGPGIDERKLKGPRVWFWAWPAPLAALIELLVLAGLVAGIGYLEGYRLNVKRRRGKRPAVKLWRVKPHPVAVRVHQRASELANTVRKRASGVGAKSARKKSAWAKTRPPVKRRTTKRSATRPAQRTNRRRR